jgi:hypothetical protein
LTIDKIGVAKRVQVASVTYFTRLGIMTVLNEHRLKSALVFTVVFSKRHVVTFRKFRQLYSEFWFPSPSPPPYNHICQIGDPVLRHKAEKLKPEDIKKNETKIVRNRKACINC